MYVCVYAYKVDVTDALKISISCRKPSYTYLQKSISRRQIKSTIHRNAKYAKRPSAEQVFDALRAYIINYNAYYMHESACASITVLYAGDLVSD